MALDDAKREFGREYLLRLLKQTQGNAIAKLGQRNHSVFRCGGAMRSTPRSLNVIALKR